MSKLQNQQQEQRNKTRTTKKLCNVSKTNMEDSKTPQRYTLKKTINDRDWEETCIILEKQPELAKEQISRSEIDFLWRGAPLRVVCSVLKAWPEAHKEKGWDTGTLVQTKLYDSQWEFLDSLAQEFPQILSETKVTDVIEHLWDAPVEFVRKYWNEGGVLVHGIRHGHHFRRTEEEDWGIIKENNWNRVMEILEKHPHVAEEYLTEDDFDELWSSLIPAKIICALLRAWPEAYRESGSSRPQRNLLEEKMFQKEWEFLDSIFNEFPDLQAEIDVHDVIHAEAPLECLEKNWVEVPMLMYAIYNRDWERTMKILETDRHLVHEQIFTNEFDILWRDAPERIIRRLLEVWPEISAEENLFGENLLQARMKNEEWPLLDTLIEEFPQILSATNAREAIRFDTPVKWLESYFQEAGVLLHSIHTKNWHETMRVLEDHPHLAKQAISTDEIDILWLEAPVTVICAVLKAWPDAYKECWNGRTLMQTKVFKQQWDFLANLCEEYPYIIAEEDVTESVECETPVQVFGLLIGQQPNALLKVPRLIFHLIYGGKLGHFNTLLKHCPKATEVKQDRTNLTPLLTLFQNETTINADWIGAVVKANPSAAKAKDFDGKYPLHLAYQHGATPEIIELILRAYPGAEAERDNRGRTPRDLSSRAEKFMFTPLEQAQILSSHSSPLQSCEYPDDTVVVCRADMLMRDLTISQQQGDKRLSFNYSQQLLTRHSIFETLLSEFSRMVGIDDKDIIQKAATIQALAVQYLSNQNDTIVDFGLYENLGYWYQQEMLKLVMRVYHECQTSPTFWRPSVNSDASHCLKDLEDRKHGKSRPGPSKDHMKAFSDLRAWLTNGLDDSSCCFQGPVLKPLQSLFNKLFIRRGQTTVHIIGDMVRATLLVDEKDVLKKIVEKIKTSFPNIVGKNFQQPDKYDELVDFLRYMHENLKVVPGSSVLPYRFKMNSSQKKKEVPLWFNFNFFLEIPEFHRVGQCEMFVACELQIGLTEEVNSHRKTHVAYEKDRILLSQPLLKNYNSCMDEIASSSNCSEDDAKLIKNVLFGRIGTETLVPNRNNNETSLSFEGGPFSLSWEEKKDNSFARPEVLCINNRSLNWHNSDYAVNNRLGYAIIIAGPYKLNGTKRYFVETFELDGIFDLMGTVGLYARVGPYLIQIACGGNVQRKECKVVESGQNLIFLEQICPVPVGTSTLEVIVYGYVKNFTCEKIVLQLKEYHLQKSSVLNSVAKK